MKVKVTFKNIVWDREQEDENGNIVSDLRIFLPDNDVYHVEIEDLEIINGMLTLTDTPDVDAVVLVEDTALNMITDDHGFLITESDISIEVTV